MNTITYEEDLQQNPLYLKLMERCSLLQEICINNWVVALPRKSSFAEQSLKNHEFILSHILSPSEELPRSHFINLIGDEVIINEQMIKFKDGAHQCVILFEEFYYTRDLQKFKIICIDNPLSAAHVKKKTKSSCSTVKNVPESVELIHQHCPKQVERKIDNAIKSFSLRMKKSFVYEQFHTNVKLLYDYCITVACARKVKEDPFLEMNMKIALEHIIMDAIYEQLFDAITIKFSEESQRFNKILRKLSSISLVDLSIAHTSHKITENLNVLRREMLKIDSSRSALGKLSALKDVIDVISSLDDKKLTATDELLPILVYLVIKTNYFYFVPTLIFIKEFNLSQILDSEVHSVGSALLYILTTLEAIIYFIKSNENMNLEKEADELMIKSTVNDADDITCQEEYMSYLIRLVRDNNAEQLANYLHVPYSQLIRRRKTSSAETTQSSSQSSVSCHPLCACEKCQHLASESTSNVNQSTPSGLRLLHATAICNAPKITSLLLAHEADVNAVDKNGFSALHYAAVKGNQKVLFLLMHSNANINLRTENDQTALMLASTYGHDHCVKALLFFSEHTHVAIDINAQDSEGMTALHYATQCGFDVIVETLLEYQAKATVKNFAGKTALDYAYNSLIRKKLDDAVKYQVEEMPFIEKEFVFADIFDDDDTNK